MVITCKFCNKEYASYSSRSNHISKYHKIIVTQDVTQDVTQSNLNNNETNTYCCSKCNKSFKFRQGKWRHEQKCNEKYSEDKINKIEKELLEYKTEMEKLKKNITKINENTS